MSGNLFLTGMSGFIGSQLFQRLEAHRYDRIFCLARNPERMPVNSQANGNLQVIQAGLEDYSTYAPFLADSDTVIHLAAATGKAAREVFFDVNARGTEQLVNGCQQHGVSQFLYMSTIAVRYPEKNGYSYAESKEIGEHIVRTSGLRYTIVRPTIVIGENAPNWNSLSRLARAPIIPLFGNGLARVQPIYLDDLVDCLIAILEEDRFHGETLELGGPDKLSMEAFLRGIRQAYSKNDGRVFRLPLQQIKSVLSRLEGRYQNVIPVTGGQLSAFGSDSTIIPNSLHERQAAHMKGVGEMVHLVVAGEKRRSLSQRLKWECRRLTSYLTGREPSAYIWEKYREAHVTARMFAEETPNAFDALLLNLSIRHPLLTRFTDAYTAIFRKRALLRKKMILLLAILESTAPNHRQFEAPDAAGPAAIVLRLAWKGVAFGLTLFLAALFLLPVQLLFTVAPVRAASAQKDRLRDEGGEVFHFPEGSGSLEPELVSRPPGQG